MEALTFNKALELYELLGAHIPDDINEEDDFLKFVGKITYSIKESEQHKRYTDAVILMSGQSWEEIKILTSEEVLELFVEGLATNRIVQLKYFCDEVGFKHG